MGTTSAPIPNPSCETLTRAEYSDKDSLEGPGRTHISEDPTGPTDESWKPENVLTSLWLSSTILSLSLAEAIEGEGSEGILSWEERLLGKNNLSKISWVDNWGLVRWSLWRFKETTPGREEESSARERHVVTPGKWTPDRLPLKLDALEKNPLIGFWN